jgi:hypothetical protein
MAGEQPDMKSLKHDAVPSLAFVFAEGVRTASTTKLTAGACSSMINGSRISKLNDRFIWDVVGCGI